MRDITKEIIEELAMWKRVSLLSVLALAVGCERINRVVDIPEPEPQPVSVSVDMTFFGDVFWGRRVQTWSKASELKEAYPFSGLDTFEKGRQENWVAHLECPTTDKEVSQYEQEEILKFNCRPTYLTEAAKHFDVFSLANNHTDNVDGEWGLQESRKNLQAHGIQHFGHFDSDKLDDVCEVVAMDAAVAYDDGSVRDGQYPVALCGYHNVFKLPSAESLAVIAEYSKYFPTFVMPQQGAEYVTRANQYQRQVYRAMIDQGADAVIGGHTHSVIDTEVYDGKLIAYSIGNFIFDQQGTEMKRTGLPITASLEIEYDANYASLTCEEFQEDCLEVARLGGLEKPTFEIDYTATPSDNANKLAKKASPEVAARVLRMANWEQTLDQLEALETANESVAD